ncbi:MAG: FHA domain-containing protein [Rhodopirellula sp.]|nr:FHA domain-containing protein [Rhodopirellula sp.]
MAISLSDQSGFTYIIRRTRLPVLLGSSRKSDIRLVDESVNGLHCMIDRTGGSWTVRDLVTKSGTYLNGARIMEAVLMAGDQLTLGRTSLRIHIDRPSPPRKRDVPSRVKGFLRSSG